MPIFSSNKQIAKNTIFLYLRMFITMAVTLYTVRIVIRTLSVSDYGLYGAVGGIILTFGFITGVLTNASQRFFSVELGKGQEGKVSEIFSTLFLTYLGVALIIVILTETIGIWFLLNKMTIPEGRKAAAMWVYQFAILSFVVNLLTNPFRALIIAHERMNFYAYLSIIDVVVKLLIVYLLGLFDFDKLKLYGVLIFASYLIIDPINILYCRLNFKETKLNWKIDRSTFKTVFSYSSWTLFGTVAGMCNTQGMNLLLNVFFGPIANAAYSVASQVYHAVGLFATSFYTAVKPPLIKNYAAKNYDYVQKLFLFSSKTLFVLLLVVVLPLMVCTKSILLVWLGEIGDYMISFVQLSLIYVTIIIISYPITAVVQAGGFVKLYHTLVDGFSILALPIVYVLFKLDFSASWAYIVSIIVFMIAHIFRLYVLKRVFSEFAVVPYVFRFMIPSVLLFIFLFVTLNFFAGSFNHNIILTLVYCGICSLSAILCGVFVLFSSSERKMVINMIRKK